MSWVMFWTSEDLEADQVMMPDQAGGGVSVAYVPSSTIDQTNGKSRKDARATPNTAGQELVHRVI